MRVRDLVVGALVLACLATVAAPVGAGPDGGDRVALVVEGAGDLEPRLRAAVRAELGGADDPKAARRVVVRIEPDAVRVQFTGDDGVAVERGLERPEDEDELVELAAWLVGNLARDQARALLDDLGPKAPPPPEPSQPVQRVELAAPTEAETMAIRAVDDVAPRATPLAADLVVAGPEAPPLTPVQVALVGPVGIFPDAVERRFAFDFSAVFGRTGGLTGFGLHGLGSHVHGDVRGARTAGLWSFREGALRGVSIAGVIQLASATEAYGIEIAGLANLDVFGDGAGRFGGLQLAGLVNAARDVRGVQFGGIANLSLSNPAGPSLSSGLQVAGAVNVAGDLRGLQLGGVTNVARDATGLQVSLATNHAGALDGLQLSSVNTASQIRGVQIGFVNVAGSVKGTQIGLINIAEENDGTAIGLLNFARNGDLQVAAWASPSVLSNVGVKMRVGPLFVLPSAGLDPIDGTTFTGQFAFGGHIPVDPLFIEIVGAWAYEETLARTADDGSAIDNDGRQVARMLVQAGTQFSEYFGIFGGTGARWDVTQTIEEKRAGLRPEVVAGILVF